MATERIDIVGYDDGFAPDFRRLNLEWLEGHGLLEPADLKYLDDPRGAILARGGQILMAVAGEAAVGTCAVLPLGSVAELVKLAVTPAAQGRGVGRRLAVAAIDYARAAGASTVVLVSNSRLTSAVRLYESLGFRHAPLPADTGYATADVYMELDLNCHEARACTPGGNLGS
jgi:ribosomal protein S18 acetylase RimI-like enzyme